MCESCRVPYEIVPAFAAWQHMQARHGFEVAYFATRDDDCRITGCTVGFQDGQPWIINYEIALDGHWCTRRAVVESHTPAGRYRVALEHDGKGAWQIGGVSAPQLTGCFDVDLESSALTNAFPVHRIGLEPGATASAPAAYVRTTLTVDRLEQAYQRLDDGVEPAGQRYQYVAPAFDFRCVLDYDGAGLVRSYPGIATRVA